MTKWSQFAVPIDIDPFHAIAISRLAHRLRAEGRSVIHMEFGQPSTGAPAAAIEAAHRILDTDGMGYWESPGLKARIAAHHGETYGVAVAPGLDFDPVDGNGFIRLSFAVSTDLVEEAIRRIEPWLAARPLIGAGR